MATKKVAPKKAVKQSSPVKKAPVKTFQKSSAKASPAKSGSPVAKKAVGAVKAAPKKTVPVKSKSSQPVVKAAQAKAVLPAHKTASKAVRPTPLKIAVTNAEPVKKPVVAATSKQDVKPVIKPLEKPVAKKEPVKPVKPVVIPKTSTTKSVKYEPDFMKSVLDKKKQQMESGPTQRYSDSELIEFRDLINRKLDTAKKELAYLQGLITRKDQSGDLDEGRYMTMEDGSMSMEREQLSQMASRQIQFIDHLEKAIMRIENKTYGICRVTGRLIDKARLRAVPHATLSMEAKQTMNK
ncbi:MAG TPA: TraR/DksA C4-type zinc finger protein [Flavisolibacter sp.]|jgi:RNA polymerase-binding transcription factor DksA|nr:TraR/DksA C4-type zinc finger protein [Flavisolibacter sp.]